SNHPGPAVPRAGGWPHRGKRMTANEVDDRREFPGVRIGFLTDTGVMRAENQDSLFVPAPGADVAARGVLVAVADGMGGHAGGATASTTAVASLEEYYRDIAIGCPLDLLVLRR